MRIGIAFYQSSNKSNWKRKRKLLSKRRNIIHFLQSNSQELKI